MMNIIEKSLRSAPSSPGCYLMKNISGDVLYIGKGKNIRKRLSSYTRTENSKTQALLREVRNIEYIVTDTETESLILEAQLIQQYHPKYNIDLQAPGRYAFIAVTKELYPRFEIARKIGKAAQYIGPYPSAAARNAALRAAYTIFRLCKNKKIVGVGGKPCFRYHIGQCSGACFGAISPEEYTERVRQAFIFLKGNVKKLLRDLRGAMEEASSKQEYEKATLYRDQIFALEKIEYQNVSAPKPYDQDVIHYIVHDGIVTIQLFHFQKGVISGRREYRFPLTTYGGEDVHDLFQDFICQYYASHGVPKELILPEALKQKTLVMEYLRKIAGIQVALTIPQRGVKKKLIGMVWKNLLLKIGEEGDRISELQRVLRLHSLPTTIDCVDISTLSGTNSVGSLVQFINGQPVKTGYRKFNIKTVTGMNDFAMIFEVIHRFGARVLEGKEKRPDLLVIDGGKGQLHAAQKALFSLSLDIPTIALAKRLEEIYVSWSTFPLRISHRSSALQLLQTLRDEAHRFAITFQRKKRQLKK